MYLALTVFGVQGPKPLRLRASGLGVEDVGQKVEGLRLSVWGVSFLRLPLAFHGNGRPDLSRKYLLPVHFRQPHMTGVGTDYWVSPEPLSLGFRI